MKGTDIYLYFTLERCKRLRCTGRCRRDRKVQMRSEGVDEIRSCIEALSLEMDVENRNGQIYTCNTCWKDENGSDATPLKKILWTKCRKEELLNAPEGSFRRSEDVQVDIYGWM